MVVGTTRCLEGISERVLKKINCQRQRRMVVGTTRCLEGINEMVLNKIKLPRAMKGWS